MTLEEALAGYRAAMDAVAGHPLGKLTEEEARARGPEILEQWKREVAPKLYLPKLRLVGAAHDTWLDRAERGEEGPPPELFFVDLVALYQVDAPEEFRIQAADRIARQLDLRIHPARGVRLSTEDRKHLEPAALFEAAHDGTPGKGPETRIKDLKPADRAEALRLLQRAARERLTQDDRGPAWREAQRREMLTEDLEVFALAAATDELSELDLAALIDTVGLTPRERAALEAVIAADAGEPQAQMAQRAGVSAGNFRQALARARKKIRAAL